MDEALKDRIQFYGKRWFNRLSLALAIFLMFPTVAIMATWNTLPGEKLYPTKRYLEGVALKLVGNNFTARADLQAQFVEQRFNEAETLLTQSSDSGLIELMQQIRATKTEIVEARKKTGTKDAIVAQKKADRLIIQLKEYSVKLETAKLAFANDSRVIADSNVKVTGSKDIPSATYIPTVTTTTTPTTTQSTTTTTTSTTTTQPTVVATAVPIETPIPETVTDSSSSVVTLDAVIGELGTVVGELQDVSSGTIDVDQSSSAGDNNQGGNDNNQGGNDNNQGGNDNNQGNGNNSGD